MSINAMRVNNYWIGFFSITLLVSCTKQLSPEDYGRFVSDPENGLRKDQAVGDMEISVMYEPVEYMLSKESGFAENTTRKEELANYEHFQFRLKLTGGGNILQYNQTELNNETSRVYHYSFDSRRDFVLIAGTDTVPCKLAHYSRNYNLSPTLDLSLAFEKVSHEVDWQFIFTDDQFGLGRVKFLFKQADIEEFPELKK
ncbi:MAG: hypothetical protein HYZ14_16190 [Bacteroidetes bacterium]|nr:hypothetical protein [Bacteroidota bacterium]